MSKLMEAYAIGSALNSAYSLAYLKAFEKAFAVQDRVARLTATQGGDEIPLFYDTWLTLSYNELDKELKSRTFTSLLSQYADALVELHSMIRQTGYPIYYFRHLLNLYMKNIAMFDSIQNKTFEHTPYDIVFTKGKARLLHYHYYYDSKNTNKKTVTVHYNLNNLVLRYSCKVSVITTTISFVGPEAASAAYSYNNICTN